MLNPVIGQKVGLITELNKSTVGEVADIFLVGDLVAFPAYPFVM